MSHYSRTHENNNEPLVIDDFSTLLLTHSLGAARKCSLRARGLCCCPLLDGRC